LRETGSSDSAIEGGKEDIIAMEEGVVQSFLFTFTGCAPGLAMPNTREERVETHRACAGTTRATPLGLLDADHSNDTRKPS